MDKGGKHRKNIQDKIQKRQIRNDKKQWKEEDNKNRERENGEISTSTGRQHDLQKEESIVNMEVWW